MRCRRPLGDTEVQRRSTATNLIPATGYGRSIWRGEPAAPDGVSLIPAGCEQREEELHRAQRHKNSSLSHTKRDALKNAAEGAS